MDTNTLFEFAARGARGARAQAEVHKLCHRDDSITSVKAAEKLVKSGKFHYSVEQVRQAIQRYCNVMMILDFTAKEIATFISNVDEIDYFKLYIVIQKRKSVLKNQAFIEETDTERNGHTVWRLK